MHPARRNLFVVLAIGVSLVALYCIAGFLVAPRFIDRALGTFNAQQKTRYVDGVADLNRRAAAKAPGAPFASLTAAQQDDLLREIEKTPFFQAVWFDTIVGTFGLPTWGGNRDYAGWHLLGFEHQPSYQPPFGYYDADINKRG